MEEYLHRRRAPAIIAGILGGSLITLVLTRHAHGLGYPVYEFDHPVVLLPYLTFLVLGGLPIALLVEYRLVTPVGVLGLAVAVWLRAEEDPGPGDPLVGFVFVVAPVWIALLIGSGIVEYWVRTNGRRLLASR